MNLVGLYGITDSLLLSDGRLIPYVEAALQGGMKLLQYRDKTNDIKKRYQEANALKELCQYYQATLIINDDIALAHQLGVGVHLGQQDSSISKARNLLGNNCVIGATCHGDLTLAERAKTEGASYLAFGRFFPSKTKPNAQAAPLEILQHVQRLQLPICAIGGITLNNVSDVIKAGATIIAVINELFDQPNPQRVKTVAQQFVERISYTH